LLEHAVRLILYARPDNGENRQRSLIALLLDREGLGDVLLELPLLRAIARLSRGAIWWSANHTTDLAGLLRQFVPAGSCGDARGVGPSRRALLRGGAKARAAARFLAGPLRSPYAPIPEART
jgi:hypothetical protein